MRPMWKAERQQHGLPGCWRRLGWQTELRGRNSL